MHSLSIFYEFIYALIHTHLYKNITKFLYNNICLAEKFTFVDVYLKLCPYKEVFLYNSASPDQVSTINLKFRRFNSRGSRYFLHIGPRDEEVHLVLNKLTQLVPLVG